MKAWWWVLAAAAVLAVLVLILRPAREGAKAKKDSGAKKKRKEQDSKNTKKRFGAECAKQGRFWNRARNKCMDPYDENDNRNCKGKIIDGWCYRTKGGKVVSDEKFDEIAAKGAKKCKPGQVWDYYKDKCVNPKEVAGSVRKTTNAKMSNDEKVFAGLCREGEKLIKHVETGLYSCRVDSTTQQDAFAKLIPKPKTGCKADEIWFNKKCIKIQIPK